MEFALESLRSINDKDQVKNVLSVLQVYINNIVKNPENPKYRKIRISNPKFNSSIWQWEPARTFLLFSGFEQEGDFLVLPSSVKLDGAKLLIDEALANKASVQTGLGTGDSAPVDQHGSVLKLSSPKGDSLFDQAVKADLTLLSYMKEMGYNVQVAEKALIATKNKGIQPAMDWINQNPGEACMKLQQATVATSTGINHQCEASGENFLASSSSTGPAPVSRYQKTADERHKFQEKLRLEAIEEARLEKQRKKLHKEYLLKDMKDEKDEKMEKVKQARLAEPENIAMPGQQCSGGESSQAELRIRMPGGQVSSISLPSNSTIQTLYQEVQQLWTSNENQSLSQFVLMTSFPQRKLSDMEATLEAAGLTPRAALVVQMADQQGVVTQGEGTVCSIRNISNMNDWQESMDETGKLLVVQFYTTWCSLCRSVADTYDSLNSKYGMNGEVLFARVNADELKVLKYREGVSSLPTFKLYWSAQAINQVEGTDMATLERLIEENKFGAVENSQDEQPQDEMDHDPR